MEKITTPLQRLFLLSALFLVFGFSPIHTEKSKPLLATGYFFDGQIRRPLLIQSLDQGSNWLYPRSIHQEPVPSDFLDGGISKYACNDRMCVATGGYYNTGEYHVPLLMQTKDLGQSWTYQDMQNKLPADFQKGWFNDTACNGFRCIAAGLYENAYGRRPLLAFYNSHSDRWHYTKSLILAPHFREAWFNTTSCDNRACIAAGAYLTTQGLTYPFLMVSQDKGSTWKSAVYKWKSIEGADNPEAHLFASTCHNGHCLAVGEYTNPQNLVTPLLIQSSTSGASWIKPKLTLPNDFLSGWFNAVDCAANFCIAVGTYSNGEINKPLLIYSPDKGRSWIYQEAVPDSELGTHLEYGAYSSASCNKKGCIAGGSFSNYFNTYPLITVSHDKGVSWHYPASARTSVPAAQFGNGYFGKVSCLKRTCIAAGDYTIESVYYPLLALSNDSGETWEFPKLINDPQILPDNFLNGHF